MFSSEVFIIEKNIDIISISYGIIQNFSCVNISTKSELISYFRNNGMLFVHFSVDLIFENIKEDTMLTNRKKNKLDNEQKNLIFFFYSLSSAKERIKL